MFEGGIRKRGSVQHAQGDHGEEGVASGLPNRQGVRGHSGYRAEENTIHVFSPSLSATLSVGLGNKPFLKKK